MKFFSQSAFDASSRYILNNARYLEKLTFGHYFISPCPEKIVKALKMYQNKDGGYGNGLEPDFRLPYSSPMATTCALNKLSQFKETMGAMEQIEKAIAYLENTYIDSINGWESTPKVVNLFPHAPWWKYNGPSSSMHGNPGAEILGYLIEFESLVKILDLNMLKTKYIDYFLSLEAFEEHELACFIKLYNRLSDNEQVKIKEQIIRGFNSVVDLDVNQWDRYVPYPLKFTSLVETNLFEVSEEIMTQNIDFLIDKITKFGYLVPSWNWGGYADEWEIAKREWAGILTLEALLNFRKIGVLK